MSYDIFQIRKAEENILHIKQVDERNTFEELKSPLQAKVIFDNLNRINWDRLIGIIPKGEYYTLKSCGVYREGDNFEADSGAYHYLSPKLGYTIRKGVIGKFNPQIRQFSEDTILSVIVPMNKFEEGYHGKSDIALFIEMVDEL